MRPRGLPGAGEGGGSRVAARGDREAARSVPQAPRGGRGTALCRRGGSAGASRGAVGAAVAAGQVSAGVPGPRTSPVGHGPRTPPASTRQPLGGRRAEERDRPGAGGTVRAALPAAAAMRHSAPPPPARTRAPRRPIPSRSTRSHATPAAARADTHITEPEQDPRAHRSRQLRTSIPHLLRRAGGYRHPPPTYKRRGPAPRAKSQSEVDAGTTRREQQISTASGLLRSQLALRGSAGARRPVKMSFQPSPAPLWLALGAAQWEQSPPPPLGTREPRSSRPCGGAAE